MRDVKDSLFLKALRKEPVVQTPVWMMRQAGRYLPEYRATRKKAGSFLDLCKNKDLACDVTLQPLKRFNLDAAILFSDILTIPDGMGLGLYFVEGEGPRFKNPVRDEKTISKLPILNPHDELQYVLEAVQTITTNLPKNLPLIGFSGSPWTLACYMVEGGSSKDFRHTLTMMYNKPKLMHELLTIIAKSVFAYCSAQIEAGADTIMIFDTWGGILTHENYQDFSLSYLDKIIHKLKIKHPEVPVIMFTKGGGMWLTDMAETKADALGLDWMTNIGYARKLVGDKVALQGNLDPSALRASPDIIKQNVKKILDDYGHGSGHIFNLGHGITPDIDPENVKVMVDSVHELSHKYHANITPYSESDHC